MGLSIPLCNVSSALETSSLYAAPFVQFNHLTKPALRKPEFSCGRGFFVLLTLCTLFHLGFTVPLISAACAVSQTLHNAGLSVDLKWTYFCFLCIYYCDCSFSIIRIISDNEFVIDLRKHKWRQLRYLYLLFPNVCSVHAWRKKRLEHVGLPCRGGRNKK